MRRALIIAGVTMQSAVFAAETNSVVNAPEANRYEAFRIINERNIFNPNRSARGSRNPDGESRRAATGESFALVGTMLYPDTQLAFFDSSSSSYKKVLKLGESIAGYKLNEVAPTGVKLETNGTTIELAVGQQMRREGEGEWKVSGKAAGETITASETSNSSGGSSKDDEDEAVKRLMKKREEEMNK